jgi:RND superfamily putative drug exporter
VDRLGLPPSAVVIVYHSTTEKAGSPPFEEATARVLAALRDAPHVTGAVSHLAAPQQVSPDGHTAYDVLTLDLAPDDSPLALPELQRRLLPVPGIEVTLAGGPAFYGDIQTVSEADLRRSELLSLPLAGLALLLVFGSVVAAGVPLVVGGAAVTVALAGLAVLASLTPMSIFVLNLSTLLGLGLGVDYSLFLVSRFREELALRRSASPTDGGRVVEEAVASTVATAGRAVLFSGLTVLLGLAGMLLFDFMILRSVGLAGVMVVGCDVAAALTLLPALLGFLGPRIDALALRRPPPLPSGDGRWGRLARGVMAHPVAVFVPTLGLLLALGIPFTRAHFNAPDATILPPSVPSRAAYDRLAAAFGEGTFAPLELAVQTDAPVTDPRTLAALYGYTRRLAADPRVRRVDSIVDLDPRITLAQYQLLYGAPGGPPDRVAAAALAAMARDHVTVVTLETPYGPNADQARQLVADLRDPRSPLAPPPGLHVLVGGGAADVTDVVARIGVEFPRTALFVIITTFLVLFFLLRSVVLPIKSLLMNALSIVASFGALVWIFQEGNLSAVLGFAPLGFVETTQPVILFCVLFGLSMDYEVFLLSRMREVWELTGENGEAVARGLERSGRIVTSAALIVVLVAGSFAAADIVLVKAIGLGVALAVGLDATVVRALLVPATMRLLGRWNWWLPAALGGRPLAAPAGRPQG